MPDDDVKLRAAIDGLETAQAYFDENKIGLDVTDAILELKARLEHSRSRSTEPGEPPRAPKEADEAVEEWDEVPTRKDVP